MNNNIYNINFLNLRNLLLILGTLTFLALSIFALLRQRVDLIYINDYTGIYISIYNSLNFFNWISGLPYINQSEKKKN